jgi:hypothetical protein
MRRRSPRSAVTLAVVTLTVVTAACGGGGDDESADTSATADTAAATTEPEVTVAPTTSPPTTEPAPTTEPPPPSTSAAPTTAPAGPTADCPQGSWIGTSAELQKFYDEIGAASGGTITVRGQVLLELTPDGTVRWTPQEWGIATDFAGAVSDATLTGTIGGTYSVDGGLLTTSNVDNQLEVSVTVNGVAIDASGALADAFAQFPINESTFACTPDGLVIGLRNVSDGFTDVVFVPA